MRLSMAAACLPLLPSSVHRPTCCCLCVACCDHACPNTVNQVLTPAICLLAADHGA